MYDIFTNNCAIKQHFNKAGLSPFPIRGTEECEINENESEDEYLEGQYESEDKGADDEDVPATGAFIQHPEDPPSFMRALNLDAIGVLEFLKYVNMAGGYVVSRELCIGTEFSDKEVVVRAINDYSISK